MKMNLFAYSHIRMEISVGENVINSTNPTVESVACKISLLLEFVSP